MTTMTTCKVAVMQMCSTDSLQENLDFVEKALPELKEKGVQLLALPECFSLMPSTSSQRRIAAEQLGDGPTQATLSRWAKTFDLWIVAGTIPILSDDSERFYATSLVYNAAGEQVLHYHKMHLFDADFTSVAGTDEKKAKRESFKESAYTVGGKEFSPVSTPWGALGLNICYDLRFPELSRALSGQRDEAPLSILVVPSAFALTTGRAHWEILLRARAIENQCFVLAPAQCGQHHANRASYGHSLIIDPWGNILAEADDSPITLIESLSLPTIEKVRQALPALAHRKINLETKVN